MGETSKDVFALLTQLMPGFLTAWVVYGFTTYTKPAQFERIVQALIYSFIVSALVELLRIALLILGKLIVLGTWNHSSELISSASVAILLGLLLSHFMANDAFFEVARKLKLTKRTPLSI
jgi:fructose-specific phosphotransferase system IIC component